LPYAQGIAGVKAVVARIEHEDLEIVPISKRILPVIEVSRSAPARVDRSIAVLRVLEALRIYAAGHADKLPDALANVTDVPIPKDPVTGKPFEYHRDGDKAYLKGPTLREVPLNYEITMVPRH
jgi:hypothetical protein